jgi:hypothetical protein
MRRFCRKPINKRTRPGHRAPIIPSLSQIRNSILRTHWWISGHPPSCPRVCAGTLPSPISLFRDEACRHASLCLVPRDDKLGSPQHACSEHVDARQHLASGDVPCRCWSEVVISCDVRSGVSSICGCSVVRLPRSNG